MNSASQSFPYHLAVLRERMLDRTLYELAVNYFLEEFAGRRGVCARFGAGTDAASGCRAEYRCLEAIGRRVEVENGFISYLREHRFVPGNAQADGTLKPEETQIRDAPYL